MMKKVKEIYILIYIGKKDLDSKKKDISFDNKEYNPKSIFTAKYESKNEKGFIKIIKLCQYKVKKSNELKFSFDDKAYSMIFNINIKDDKDKEQYFIFDINLKEKYIIDQNKIEYYEKFLYFKEALVKNKEKDKLDILYDDAIKLYDNKPKFEFLVNIFVEVYSTNYGSKLLNSFGKNCENPHQKDNIEKKTLEKFKDIFNEIYNNSENLISEYDLKPVDLYGLILCYLNIYDNENFLEKFKQLYEKNKNILFEILAKYKSYFKNEIDMNHEFLNELITFLSKNKFKEFKNVALFYLKDIITFLEIIIKNKENLINNKDFEPIEVTILDGMDIKNFEKINEKIEEFIKSYEEKKEELLIYFTEKFWDKMLEFCSIPEEKNIKLCFELRQKFEKYYTIVTLINEKKNLKNQSEKNSHKIKDNIVDKPSNRNIKEFVVDKFAKIYTKKTIGNKNIKKSLDENLKKYHNKDPFATQLNKMIKNYIKDNEKITNEKIIEYIKNYDIFYSDEKYKSRRTPEIFDKLDFEKIDDNFINDFKDMEFENKFKSAQNSYYIELLNKIEKIEDFNYILRLINYNLIDDKRKYLLKLKAQYKKIIGRNITIKDNDKAIEALIKITDFFYRNENNCQFLEENIVKSKLDNELKNIIYLKLIELCNDKQHVKMKEFIEHLYLSSLDSNLNHFITFIEYLEPEDYNNLINKIDDKYIISEHDFYNSNFNLKVELLYLLYKNDKINEDNKYYENSIKVLENIFKSFEEELIKIKDLNLFFENNEENSLKKIELFHLLSYLNLV